MRIFGRTPRIRRPNRSDREMLLRSLASMRSSSSRSKQLHETYRRVCGQPTDIRRITLMKSFPRARPRSLRLHGSAPFLPACKRLAEEEIKEAGPTALEPWREERGDLPKVIGPATIRAALESLLEWFSAHRITPGLHWVERERCTSVPRQDTHISWEQEEIGHVTSPLLLLPSSQGSISGQHHFSRCSSDPSPPLLQPPCPIKLSSCLISESPHRFPMRRSYPCQELTGSITSSLSNSQ